MSTASRTWVRAVLCAGAVLLLLAGTWFALHPVQLP